MVMNFSLQLCGQIYIFGAYEKILHFTSYSNQFYTILQSEREFSDDKGCHQNAIYEQDLNTFLNF